MANHVEKVEKKSNVADRSLTGDRRLSDHVVTFELVPPDGGWGYVIVLAMTVMTISVCTPMASFGIFFSEFLRSIGNETTGTTISNAMFNTVSSFLGLATNYLLKKYSYRKVALLGALVYASGAFGIIFAQTMIQFIFFYGFLQGIGFGLLFPATCTAFNCYFNKKLNLMMSISLAIMAASNMSFPVVAEAMMKHLGFRWSVTVIASVSLLNIPAMALMQPIKWHLKKVAVGDFDDAVLSINNEKDPEEDFNKANTIKIIQHEPLLSKNMIENHEFNDKHINNKLIENVVYNYEKRTSIISLGGRAVAVSNENIDFQPSAENNERTSVWQSVSNFMDLSLLKDIRYLNVSIGLALSYMSDMAFISLIPLLLTNSGFNRDQVAFGMTIFFGLDLLGRVSITFTSMFCKKLTNWHLYLMGTTFSAIFRAAFVARDDYVWKLMTLGSLGMLRAYIQTPFSLVISEKYPENFATAFSLCMVMVGCVSTVIGPALSIIKYATGSDVMACHLLTFAFATCSVAWILEATFWRTTNKK